MDRLYILFEYRIYFEGTSFRTRALKELSNSEDLMSLRTYLRPHFLFIITVFLFATTIFAQDPPPQSLADADQQILDEKVTLKIISEPTGASVAVNEIKYGKTPALVEGLEIGTHQIELSKSGHYRRVLRVTVNNPGERELSLKLQAPASLAVISEPSDAQISIDDKVVGSTPFRIPQIRPGDYTLTSSLSGYKPLEKEITLESGAQDTLRLILETAEAEMVYQDQEPAQEQATDTEPAQEQATVTEPAQEQTIDTEPAQEQATDTEPAQEQTIDAEPAQEQPSEDVTEIATTDETKTRITQEPTNEQEQQNLDSMIEQTRAPQTSRRRPLRRLSPPAMIAFGAFVVFSFVLFGVERSSH
ncbi:PEGA domain-containing protein [Chitinispirillales bacterium ANBcel5]|uniref:PEGA domain-containing protein n=1 Tax=Cellulosispirillum alkaliphilum TaxID=3039283 RepID=UPI002A548FD6|nr:PEGA domain-containing protein [Chitinispirillales bacterium ANBcel5]